MHTFDGQQEGERILFEVHPHGTVRHIAFVKIFTVAALFFIIGAITGLFLPGLLIAALVIVVGIWWNNKYFIHTISYITDRRIMRFELVSPFQTAKRALFWNEALKAKAYEPNLILQKFNIGTLIIEPTTPSDENVIIPHVHFAEDLANYIDKILYIHKNNPQELSTLKPFIAKAKGTRD